MTIVGVPAATTLVWLLAIAFFGAGIFNMVGPASVREGFVRWGYPAWWNVVTGALELLTVALLAVPATRAAGLMLGLAISIAAVATVVRYREYAHMAPGLVLIVLSVLAFACLTA